MPSYFEFPCVKCGTLLRADRTNDLAVVHCWMCDCYVTVPKDSETSATKSKSNTTKSGNRPKKTAPKSESWKPIVTRKRSHGVPIVPLALLVLGLVMASGVIITAVVMANSAKADRARAEKEAAKARAALDAEKPKQRTLTPAPLKPKGNPNPALLPPAPFANNPAPPLLQDRPKAQFVERHLDLMPKPLPPQVVPPVAPPVGPIRKENGWIDPDKLAELPPALTYSISTVRPKAEFSPGYYRVTVHGFTLMISREAFEQIDKLKGQPLGCLEADLLTVTERVPTNLLGQLKRVKLWVEWDHTVPGRNNVLAVYHGKLGENLALTGVDPRKAGCVTIMSLKDIYLSKSRNRFHKTVTLHELAHAVHDQVFGLKNPFVRNAYAQADTRKLYRKVEHTDGTIRDGYCTTSEAEYFAELTCCYLDQLDYHPFEAKILRDYDSVGYEIMTKVWGTQESIEKAKEISNLREREARQRTPQVKRPMPAALPPVVRKVVIRATVSEPVILADSKFTHSESKSSVLRAKWLKEGSLQLLKEPTDAELLDREGVLVRVRLKGEDWYVLSDKLRNKQ